MIGFKVRNLATIPANLRRFGREFQGVATMAAAVYLVGNEARGLKHEPNYKYVSRKSAYGKTFVSDKQRRYVMAMIRSGRITPGTENRTHAIQNGWGIQSNGLDTRITNRAPGVGWVMGNREHQARQPAAVGWRSFEQVSDDNRAGMSRASSQAVQALMRALLVVRGG